jgi:hypothetical protein
MTARKVRPIVEFRLRALKQFHPSFVDQRGGLERMPGLVSQEALSDAPQFAIYQRHQAVEGRGVPLAPALQQTCDFGGHPAPRYCLARAPASSALGLAIPVLAPNIAADSVMRNEGQSSLLSRIPVSVEQR